MRAVLQRVRSASVTVADQCIGKIERGLLVLLGIGAEDDFSAAERLLDKIVKLRVFPENDKNFHLSLLDIQGGMLVISQFTLYADCRKGRRPSFTEAALPDDARKIYSHFVEKAKAYRLDVQEGEFGAMMDVDLCNEGPVTILLDTQDIR